MGNIITIFLKEMKDMLRDRRTVLTMIVMPILLMPLLLTVTSSFTKSQVEKAQDQDLKIAIDDKGSAAELVKRLKRRKDVKVFEGIQPTDFNQMIRNDSIDLAIKILDGFDAALAGGKTAKVNILYNVTDDKIVKERLETTIERYNKEILNARLDSLGANMATITPIEIEETNVFNQKESIGKMAGGFLPYMFVLFCLMGAMYPAIDLFTGEKERGTIETILSVPASRLQILIGKMMVVVISGVLSGVLTILGLYLAMKLTPDIPEFMKDIAADILSPASLTWIILMLIPLTTFFSGILIPASIYSKSFKEAQSLIQPLVFVVIMPLIIGMMPGIKLNAMTALIPVVNVALATKEIIAGTIDYGLLALVFLSLFAFAAIGILLCVRWFGHEGNILRT